MKKQGFALSVGITAGSSRGSWERGKDVLSVLSVLQIHTTASPAA